MRLKRVTFTGADDTVNPHDVIAISKDYPFVEWGILVSAQQAGAVRFPSYAWCRQFAELVTPEMNVSTHVCGRWVRDFVMGTATVSTEQVALWDRTNRVQLNTHAEPHQFHSQRLAELIATWSKQGKQFIFQYDGVNERMWDAVYEADDQHIDTAPLYDLSHGAGVVPGSWPRNEFMDTDVDHAYSGYAGGLSPENTLTELPKIAVAACGDFWIDMETRVRSDDGRKFDLQKCVDVLKKVSEFVAA
jgi:phosphoribosylanthranilate isomerase